MYSSSVVTSKQPTNMSAMDEKARQEFFLQLLEKYDQYVESESRGSQGEQRDDRLLKEQFLASSLFSGSGFPSGSNFSQYPKIGHPIMSPNESFAPKQLFKDNSGNINDTPLFLLEADTFQSSPPTQQKKVAGQFKQRQQIYTRTGGRSNHTSGIKIRPYPIEEDDEEDSARTFSREHLYPLHSHQMNALSPFQAQPRGQEF